jgi:NAD(P)-dependent dehydrogenase (short-subunit alcohol dehydrogenase family)
MINSFFHQIKILTGAFVVLVTLMVPYSSNANDNEYVPTTLITGANRGIGFEFAKQYLAKGWNVIATCRKPETADQLILLQKQFPSLLIIDRLDVTDHSQIDQLAEKYSTIAIDVLLNNAGISGDTKNQIFGTMNYDVYHKVLAVNTIGPLKMAEAFYPHVKASEQKKNHYRFK